MKAKELIVTPFSSILGCGIWDGEKHLVLIPNNSGKEDSEKLASIVLCALNSPPAYCPTCEHPTLDHSKTEGCEYEHCECIAAAAEPAPERTPPQDFQSQLRTYLENRITLIDGDTHSHVRNEQWQQGSRQTLRDVLGFIDRAVAVPEPAQNWDAMCVCGKNRAHHTALGQTGQCDKFTPAEPAAQQESVSEDDAWAFAEDHKLDLTQKYDHMGVQMRLDDLLPLFANWLRSRQAEPAPTPSLVEEVRPYIIGVIPCVVADPAQSAPSAEPEGWERVTNEKVYQREALTQSAITDALRETLSANKSEMPTDVRQAFDSEPLRVCDCGICSICLTAKVAQLERECGNRLNAVNTYVRLLSKEVGLRQAAETRAETAESALRDAKVRIADLEKELLLKNRELLHETLALELLIAERKA